MLLLKYFNRVKKEHCGLLDPSDPVSKMVPARQTKKLMPIYLGKVMENIVRYT